jgi:predicted MFS family arabinose efflux permease
VGIAGGAAIGAALLSAGVTYGMLPLAGIVSSGVALVLALVSITLSRRGIS